MVQVMLRHCIVCGNTFGHVEIQLGVITKKECWRCADISCCRYENIVDYTGGICGPCEQKRLEAKK